MILYYRKNEIRDEDCNVRLNYRNLLRCHAPPPFHHTETVFGLEWKEKKILFHYGT